MHPAFCGTGSKQRAGKWCGVSLSDSDTPDLFPRYARVFAGAMDGFAMEAMEKHGWRTWISAGIVRLIAAHLTEQGDEELGQRTGPLNPARTMLHAAGFL